MDVASRVDVGGQGAVHRHTKHMFLLCDHRVTVLTTQVCKLLKNEEKHSCK
jgi:hypothetical protein